jgi:hypothetical protein
MAEVEALHRGLQMVDNLGIPSVIGKFKSMGTLEYLQLPQSVPLNYTGSSVWISPPLVAIFRARRYPATSPNNFNSTKLKVFIQILTIFYNFE